MDWLILLVAVVWFVVGLYIGYTIGRHHGWKEGYNWKDRRVMPVTLPYEQTFPGHPSGALPPNLRAGDG